MREKWEPIKAHNMFAYDGRYRYEVSNRGRVRRAGYYGYKNKFNPARMMKLQIEEHGRYRVTLQADNKAHTFFVNRLVALAFLNKPSDAKHVIHIDGNVQNNRVENLMWASSTRVSPYVVTSSKAVRQYTKDGKFVAEYSSATEVQRVLGFDHSTISACCHRKKRRRTSFGFIWRFATDDEFAHEG